MAKRRRGLGSMGVDALLSDTGQAADFAHVEAAAVTRDLAFIGIEKIHPSRYQPRLQIDETALQELTESIKEQGLIQPLALRCLKDKPGQYELIAGERRWRAAQRLGLEKVPAMIRDVDEQQAAMLALIENIQRTDLNPLEEAIAMFNTAETFHLTHQEVATQLGCSRSTVTNLMRLLELDEAVQRQLNDGLLDMGHARALLRLDKTKQGTAARTVVSKKMTVRQTEAYIKKLLTQQGSDPSPQRPANIVALERELATTLGTSVRIEHKKSGHGKMVIQYSDLDVLDGILKKIR